MGGLDGSSRQPEKSRQAILRRLREVDWDFATEYSNSPFSALHWHPCRFPSQLAALLIGRLSREGERILDPFMGSGTTLVEAQRLGRPAYGMDVNPVACLIAKSKLYNADGEQVAQHIEKLIRHVRVGWSSIDMAQVPGAVQADKWYGKNTLRELRKLWALVSQDEGGFPEIGQSAFSAVLLRSCHETRHWGYVCDNTSPKSYREVEAREVFVSVLRKFQAAYRSREQRYGRTRAEALVFQGDAAALLGTIAKRSVSCVVTSPPYQGVADYVKAQRLSMEWFGWEIEPLRRAEIGARSKRRRGGAIEEFLDELEIAFSRVHDVLVEGGVAAVVYGSSPARRNTVNEFLERAGRIGFQVESRMARNISNARRQAPSLAQEEIIVLRKE